VKRFHQYCGTAVRKECRMDRFRKIEILVRVADAGSFAKAARTLLLSPSAVSHAITQLEQELAARLFYRTTRQMRLTAEGAEVVLRGREVLERMAELDTAAHRGRDRIAGSLRIGIPSGVSRHIVMPRIADFMRQFPDIRLQVMNTSSVRDMHVSGADINIHVGEMVRSISASMARRTISGSKGCLGIRKSCLTTFAWSTSRRASTRWRPGTSGPMCVEASEER
jgi:DNA-binding transcriptional LysR family regulator